MSTGAGSNEQRVARRAAPLTPCEFEIMEILWRLGSATVRDVHSALKTSRGLAYTTVMTVMDKLHRKGALHQQRRGRAYFYTVQLERAEALHRRTQCLIDEYFEGSAEMLLAYLLEEFIPSSPVPSAARPAQPKEEPLSGEMDTALL
jgi:predicted transcriptional regulator